MKEKTKKEKQGHASLFELAGARKNKLTLACLLSVRSSAARIVPFFTIYGVGVAAVDWNGVSEKKKKAIEKATSSIAKRIIYNSGNIKPEIKTKGMFWIMHLMQKNGFNPRDAEYWKEKGWTGKIRPWK